MATTRITATRNGTGGLAYATKQGEPHEKGTVDKRVLTLGAVNCSILNFRKQMQAVWRANRTKRNNKIELYRITQSFSTQELDVNNPDDVLKCNQIGVETARRLYPDKLVVVSTQGDGKGGKLHNHIDVCSPGFVDGKALRGERTNQGHIAYISDAVCKDYGLAKPSNLPQISPNQLRSKSGKRVNFNLQLNSAKHDKSNKSFLYDLQARIEKTLKIESVTDFDKFKTAAENNGVDVRIRKNKKGKINGLSYKLNDGSHKRAVRASKLGSNFEAGFLNNVFERNLKIKNANVSHDVDEETQAKARELIKWQNERRRARALAEKENQVESPIEKPKKTQKTQKKNSDYDLDL